MTRDTIDRAVKRGAGGAEDDNLEEVRYEGYGPNGVAVMVDCLTDNRNRTVAEVRHVFSKAGGNLGQEGSVAYLFIKQGQIIFAPQKNEEAIMESAIEAGAEDVEVQDDKSIEVTTAPEALVEVLNTLTGMKAVKVKPEIVEVTMVPASLIALEGEPAEKLMKMLDALEDLDDVQQVYANVDFPKNMV